MFWILRRTGAANFFNSLNNNCNTPKNNNNVQGKNAKRPPRKAYGRLSGDSDDASSGPNKAEKPQDEKGNYDMITSAKRDGKSGNLTVKTTLAKNCPPKIRYDKKDYNNGGIYDKPCVLKGCNESTKFATADCEGNFIENRLCDFDDDNICNGSDYSNNSNTASGSTVGFLKPSSSSSTMKQKEVNEDTINRLHAMAMSEDEDYDESLTCNVCDRAFHCHRQLASHQQKKRHFGCGGCDSLFPSLMLLEHHKEEFEHWSDDEIDNRVCCRRNRGDDYFTDTDSFTSEAESEDLERLL